MHELSIADAIVRIACAHAGERRIETVEVKVGHLRQVVPDSLAFAFTLVAEGTVAEGAELVLEVVPAAGVCRALRGGERTAGLPARVRGAAGAWIVELVRGEELLVDALTMEGVPSGRS